MGKAPAFQFYPGDWRRDTQVQMATMETRGVWFELLCCMWDAPERGKVEGGKDDICRMLGCNRQTFDRALNELIRLKIADVTNCHNNVTIINRRMYREQKTRDNARLRKQRQRKREGCHGPVTPPSSPSSSSSPSKNNIYTDSFLKFWNVYPKKVGKKNAFKAFQKAKEKPPIGELVKIIESHKKSDQWKRDNGQYIPNPATWLNQGRWEDELPEDEQQKKRQERIARLKQKYPGKGQKNGN